MKKQVIYNLVDQKGLKMSHLINNSGVSRKTFYDYLNNRLPVTDSVLLNVANILGVKINTISK